MSDQIFDRSEFVSYFRDEAGELLDRIDADLLGLEGAMETGGCDPELVNALFRSLHTIKGSAGMLEFTVVQRLAHRLENAIDLLRSGRITLDDHMLELIFIGRDLLSEVITRAVGGDTTPVPGVDPFLTQLESFLASPSGASELALGTVPSESMPSLTPMLSDEDAAVAEFEAEVARLLAEQLGDTQSTAAEPIAAAPIAAAAAASSAPTPVSTPAPTSATPSARSTSSNTIRVDLDRLDALLDLVGELVINRTQITDVAAALQRAVERDPKSAIPLAKDLGASSATLARITNELQETVMKARMVPIGQVFERFPRTVRDLAKTTGKPMVLAMAGVETDLDKTIVDQIGEPLMHLVRNCADHGIEEADVRLKAGKPAVATISLNAYHEGNQVIITVGEDGGGINLERIRARGIERGLIQADDVHSDAEILDLIFAPGFSTAAAVSNLSGRGVGMDVVRRCVTDLKGTLDVDTQLGFGTTFTIRLPLTLAIIRTLLVSVSERLFAIPLDIVVESQRIAPAAMRTIGGGSVVTLRGAVVPLISIADAFGLPRVLSSDEHVMIVIVRNKGRHVGLIVDAFEGDQEIVIKPLSEFIGATYAIAGATILGNGAVALILDVGSLASGISRLEALYDQEKMVSA